MAGLTDTPLVQAIAIPAVVSLILFLGIFSQLLFHFSTTLEPGPLSTNQTFGANALLFTVLYTYYKAVAIDPGRYVFPDKVIDPSEGARWCRKCTAPKPPRAHHCRHCARCVPKMDHHCPWLRNCVSMTTFPYFLRFLVWANFGLATLGYLVLQRFSFIWQSRHLPAYLGPSLPALIGLSTVGLVNAGTSLALAIMLITAVKGWLFNRTLIEGWELERHEALLEKSGRDWWDMTGPDGKKIRFERVEFPYDVGIFTNMAVAMGTANPLLWFFPFAGGPKVDKAGAGDSGWVWEENGFNRTEGLWPPPDPEKIRQAAREWPAGKRDYMQELKDLDDTSANAEERKKAFQKRQAEDARRRKMLMAELEEVDGFEVVDEVDYEDVNGDDYDTDDSNEDEDEDAETKERREPASVSTMLGWMNSDGERLQDYGVDEDEEGLGIDEAHDDDVPLAELIRRRKVTKRDDQE